MVKLILLFALVNYISQFCDKYTCIHVTAIKRIFRYLKETEHFGLLYQSNSNTDLIGYSDADYAGDRDTRKSRTGSMFQMGSCTISWTSQKQTIVAMSTTEAEYVAASQTLKDLIWLDRMRKEFIKEKLNTPELKVDNQSAIMLIKNHLSFKYNFWLQLPVISMLFYQIFINLVPGTRHYN